MDESVPKVGIALSGGTTYGVAHIGVLKAFKEHNIPIHCISGTSAGSLVAACYAFGMPVDQMTERAISLSWKQFSRFAYSALGINTNEPLAAFITDLLGDVNIEDAKIPLAIVATNIESYEMVVLTHGRVRDAVRASTCLPGIFAPVELNGMLLVDGALSENVPVSPLATMGATIKVGVNLLARPRRAKPRTIFDILNNSFTTLAQHRDAQLSTLTDFLIEPDLMDFDGNKFKDTPAMIDAGYMAAMKVIPQLQQRLAVASQPQTIYKKVKTFFERYF